MAKYVVKNEDREICLDLMDQHEKVKAIKYARQVSGCGLKEAKDWVESGCLMLTAIAGDVWEYSDDCVDGLMDELFLLTKRMAEIHKRLEELNDA